MHDGGSILLNILILTCEQIVDLCGEYMYMYVQDIVKVLITVPKKNKQLFRIALGAPLELLKAYL